MSAYFIVQLGFTLKQSKPWQLPHPVASYQATCDNCPNSYVAMKHSALANDNEYEYENEYYNFIIAFLQTISIWLQTLIIHNDTLNSI